MCVFCLCPSVLNLPQTYRKQMRIKRLHRWDIPPSEAKRLQERLSKRLKLKFLRIEVKRIAACDVSIFKDKKEARSCVAIFSYPQLDLLSEVIITDSVRYPYIPGLLTFREGPILLKALKRIKEKVDVLLFDGQGIAHPRRMGIASHIGLWLDKPSIGCAKSHLYGSYKLPKLKKGDLSYIYDRANNKIGVSLCTRDNVKPIYISPGHKMDLDTAVKIVSGCVKNFRIPEPLRVVHIKANV